jgi:hypothetical protein
LDEHKQRNEQPDEQQEKGRGKRQVMQEKPFKIGQQRTDVGRQMALRLLSGVWRPYSVLPDYHPTPLAVAPALRDDCASALSNR